MFSQIVLGAFMGYLCKITRVELFGLDIKNFKLQNVLRNRILGSIFDIIVPPKSEGITFPLFTKVCSDISPK